MKALYSVADTFKAYCAAGGRVDYSKQRQGYDLAVTRVCDNIKADSRTRPLVFNTVDIGVSSSSGYCARHVTVSSTLDSSTAARLSAFMHMLIHRDLELAVLEISKMIQERLAIIRRHENLAPLLNRRSERGVAALLKQSLRSGDQTGYRVDRSDWPASLHFTAYAPDCPGLEETDGRLTDRLRAAIMCSRITFISETPAWVTQARRDRVARALDR